MKFKVGKDRDPLEIFSLNQVISDSIAIPDVASYAPDIAFDVEHFQYTKENDEYTCPAGQKLTTNGRWYNKNHGKTTNKMKHYKTNACLSCTLFERCTQNKKGRLIERTEHADLIHANKERIEKNKEIYRKRQAIVEHPFGIIIRQWDFYYIMTKKSIKRASADVGLIFVCYNLRRIMNLVDKNLLKAYLKGIRLIFSTHLAQCKAPNHTIFILHPAPSFFSTFINSSLKTTSFSSNLNRLKK